MSSRVRAGRLPARSPGYSLLRLVRGAPGHPSHPPLTDASIGAYTAGTLVTVAGWLGLAPDGFPMAEAGFLAIAVGLLFAIPAMVTGFADYVAIPRGTGLRRAATVHWIAMSAGTAAFAAAAALLTGSFGAARMGSLAPLVTLAAFTLLVVGGYVGGTVVFGYGLRVTKTAPETPLADALRPMWPPD